MKRKRKITFEVFYVEIWIKSYKLVEIGLKPILNPIGLIFQPVYTKEPVIKKLWYNCKKPNDLNKVIQYIEDFQRKHNLLHIKIEKAKVNKEIYKSMLFH